MDVIPMGSSWLFPEERPWVIQQLLNFGLIKYDNRRELPLKSGGKTDIYINLRDARNNPKAISFLATLFATSLQRLDATRDVSRFVEVPDSVSCFAGSLAVLVDMPYLTIREQGKEGRVADAKVIGTSIKGERVVILDDVITNGASKIIPHQKCAELGLDNQALVVLVDRQQGWQQHLLKAGIRMPVWAGMTLDDVRRYLIETGIMQRCALDVERLNPIILALDGKSWDEILPIIDELRVTGCILKVNDLLFNEGIEYLLPKLTTYGRIMADLKIHDIPNTAANIAKRLLVCPPWAVTVHGSGGGGMIKAVVDALAATDTKVLVVTVLTSIDKETCEEIYTCLPLDQVARLAEIAYRAGAQGLVCSPEEVADLRAKYPDMTLVTPGIRSVGQDADDQKRIATPAKAIANGSNHLVMGRQIFGAPDPVAEVKRLLKEELNITL